MTIATHTYHDHTAIHTHLSPQPHSYWGLGTTLEKKPRINANTLFSHTSCLCHVNRQCNHIYPPFILNFSLMIDFIVSLHFAFHSMVAATTGSMRNSVVSTLHLYDTSFPVPSPFSGLELTVGEWSPSTAFLLGIDSLAPQYLMEYTPLHQVGWLLSQFP